MFGEENENMYYILINNLPSKGDDNFESVITTIKKWKHNNVRVIRWNNNELTAKSMIRLEHVLKTKKGNLPSIKVQVLTLRNNKIGTIGAETISSFLKTNNTLKYLDLSFNLFGDKALESISQGINNCSKLINCFIWND